MARNRHGVTKRMWNKWQGMGQAMYNRLYAQIGEESFPGLTEEQFKVARANACFLAACVARDLQDELDWNAAILRKNGRKNLSRCDYANKYKGIHPPKCGCDVCAMKWLSSELHKYVMQS